jgi:hypothetical protein
MGQPSGQGITDVVPDLAVTAVIDYVHGVTRNPRIVVTLRGVRPGG